MTEENAALTATIKAGAGYEAPWIVVRADNPQQLAERLNAVANGLTGPLVAAAEVLQGEWASHQQGAGGRMNPGNQNFGNQGGGWGGNSGGSQNANAQAQAFGNGPPRGTSQTCAHGEMQWKQGTSKASGKDYAGWFCPSKDRNNQCSPVWPEK